MGDGATRDTLLASHVIPSVKGNDIRNFVPTCQKSLFGARPRPDDRAHARTRRTHDDAHPTHMTAQAVVGLVRDVRGVVGVVRRVTRKDALHKKSEARPAARSALSRDTGWKRLRDGEAPRE